MNDFTKEELQLLHDKLSNLKFSEFEGCGFLFLKIKSMIDNYCEHQAVIPVFGIVENCSQCSVLVDGHPLRGNNDRPHI